MGDGINRREVLAAAAAGALAVGGATALAAEPKAAVDKRGYKKSLMWGMVRHEGTLLDKFKMLKDVGFDGVEMDAPTRLKKAEILEARDKTGLAISGVVDAVHWNIHLTDPDEKQRNLALDALKTAIRECKEFGGQSVLLVPGVVNKRVHYDHVWDRSIEMIKQAIPVAEETGVKIAIENVWNGFLLSPLEAARYVDEFKSPMVGFHFDIGNVINFGWPEQWVRILGKRIVKLHIKEYSRKKRDAEGPGKGFGVDLLEGDNDWPAVMKALDEVGYKGWASAEVAGGGAERLKVVAGKMDQILSL